MNLTVLVGTSNGWNQLSVCPFMTDLSHAVKCHWTVHVGACIRTMRTSWKVYLKNPFRNATRKHCIYNWIWRALLGLGMCPLSFASGPQGKFSVFWLLSCQRESEGFVRMRAALESLEGKEASCLQPLPNAQKKCDIAFIGRENKREKYSNINYWGIWVDHSSHLASEVQVTYYVNPNLKNSEQISTLSPHQGKCVK